jgi:hypothetical protein
VRKDPLKKALSEWNYDEFKGIIKNNKNLFNNSDIIIKNLDESFDLLQWSARYLDEISDLLKGIWKVAKFF